MLSDAQRAFVDLLFRREALKFGDFTLKSGRKSPYFINTGCFNNGGDLARLGSAYGDAVRRAFGDQVDVVFGPAYKGIPLALAAAAEYEKLLGRPVGWTYDRKEAKDHGDGGLFVGAALKPGLRVVVVDDVLTAGTALRESLAKLRPTGVAVAGAVVAVDRQERGKGARSAIEEIREELGITVVPIVTISEAADHLAASGALGADLRAKIAAHLAAAG
ncbi:MAG: orotate phosphoribosyltransferase [Planctomycetaceae bacterium]|nr:orotate phosphoribosyltransferase [Planctomycetaceae bacterium]